MDRNMPPRNAKSPAPRRASSPALLRTGSRTMPTLENWKWSAGNTVTGNVYGKLGTPDGTQMMTSTVPPEGNLGTHVVTESGSSYLLGKPEDVSTAREAVAERKAATITNFKNGPHSLGYLDKTNMSSRRSVGSTIARVYATAGVGVAIAAYGSHIHFRPSSAPGWMPAAFTTGSDYMTIAQIVFALLLNYSCRAPFILRFGLFSAVAYSAGLNVGTWIHMALVESGACPRPGSIEWFLTSKSKSCSMLDSTILIAFIYTAGIYFCFSAAALLGNRNNKVFMYVSSLLFAGSWVMWGSYLLARFGLVSDAVFDAVYIKMGLILYSLKVWYDTYAMVSKIESSSEVDVLDLALNALLNFLQIFIRVIQFVEKVRQKTRK